MHEEVLHHYDSVQRHVIEATKHWKRDVPRSRGKTTAAPKARDSIAMAVKAVACERQNEIEAGRADINLLRINAAPSALDN